MTPDFFITSALGCAARRDDHLRVCCHWTEPGMGIPQAGIAEKYFILQSYSLRFIWITAYSFMCLSLGGEKVSLTCVAAGRRLFSPAVLTDMLGVLLGTPLTVVLPEKLM